jgi:hypothetical protein
MNRSYCLLIVAALLLSGAGAYDQLVSNFNLIVLLFATFFFCFTAIIFYLTSDINTDDLLLRRTLHRSVRYSAYYFSQSRKVNKSQRDALNFASLLLSVFA